MDLTEEQWKIVEPILPEDPVRDDGRGRPWSDRRKVLNGVLWILRTGAPWQDLPPRYGPYQTAHRRSKTGSQARGHGASAAGAGPTPQGRRRIDLKECFMWTGRLCHSQKRGRQVGKTKRGKGTKIMGIPDGYGLPLALRTESASPAEVKLVAATLEERIVAEVPERFDWGQSLRQRSARRHN